MGPANGLVLVSQGRYDEADVLLGELLPVVTSRYGPADDLTLGLRHLLVECRIAEGRLEEAAKLADALLEATPPDSPAWPIRRGFVEATRR